MIILEIYQKQPFDIIALTLRGTFGLCHVHIAQLMTHTAIYTLPFTLQLCYKPLGILQKVTKSQKVHISSHDALQKLHNINFACYRSWGFLREGLEKQEFSPSPINIFENNQKPFSWNLRVDILWQTKSREKVGFPIPGHPCCNKNFQILITSGFYELADDANKNHSFISCLFIL